MQLEFKSWTRLLAFHFMLMFSRKALIPLFSKGNSWTDLILLAFFFFFFFFINHSRRKTLIQTSCTLLKNWPCVKSSLWWRGWLNTCLWILNKQLAVWKNTDLSLGKNHFCTPYQSFLLHTTVHFPWTLLRILGYTLTQILGMKSLLFTLLHPNSNLIYTKTIYSTEYFRKN